MAKIENIEVYPTVTPAADDLLIATDVSDNNKTVTFTVGSIGSGSSVLQGLQSVLNEGNIATQSITLNGGPGGNGYIDLCQILLSGNVGAAGQVLTSQGAAACAIWATPSGGGGSCCSLQDTTNVGSTTTNTVTLGGGNLIMNTTNGQLQLNSGSDLILSSTSEINFAVGSAINDSTGATGNNGDVLTVVGGNITWQAPAAAACCNLQQTLTAGNQANNIGISLTNTSPLSLDATSNIVSAGTNTFSGVNTFSSTLDVDGCLEDSVGSCGVSGQVLSSTGTAVAWINNTALQDLQSVLTTGDTAVEDINLTGTIDLSGDLVLGANTQISANGSTGTPGQYLIATATGVEWSTLSSACCNLNDTLAVGNTSGFNMTLTGSSVLTVPTITPTNINVTNGTGGTNQILQSNGGVLSWVNNTAAGMTQFFVVGDSGPNQTITDSDSLTIAGGTGLSSVASVTDTITLNLDDTTVVPGTYTAATITVNQQGQITSAGSNTVSDTTYDLSSVQSGSNSNLTLIGSDGTTDTVQIIAGTNITITDSGSALTIDAAGASGMTSFLAAGDTGVNQTITNGNTLTIEGGTGMETAAAAGDKVIVTLSDTAVTPGNYLNANIIVNQQGQITSVASGNNATATYTSAQNGLNVDMTYAQINPTNNDIVKLVAGSNITLTDNGSNEITIASTGGGTGMTSFDVAANSGATQTITNGNTLTIAQGTGISTVASATDTVTITNTGVTSLSAGSNITLSASTGAVTISAAAGGTGNHRIKRSFYNQRVIQSNPANTHWIYADPIDMPAATPNEAYGNDLMNFNVGEPASATPSGSIVINQPVFINPSSSCALNAGGLHTTYTLCAADVWLSHSTKGMRVEIYKINTCVGLPDWVPVQYCDILQDPDGLRTTQCCRFSLDGLAAALLRLDANEAHCIAVSMLGSAGGAYSGSVIFEYSEAEG